MVTVWVGSDLSASCECFSVARSLMSWKTFPPKAIASVWIPRQMPSIGI